MIIDIQNCNWNVLTYALGDGTNKVYISGLDAAE